ncbi:MAG: transketolase [Candidatus Curtissbacteria bacterium]|nr:transketolase [Candidatus Curtissbacteria bacterium]
MNQTKVNNLEALAKLVRFYILRMSTKAGSGHPTSSLSAADLMTALFFGHLKSGFDHVIFSKGHASPLLYALYTAAGEISESELDTYRKFGSILEGHPNPRFKFAEVATGSLGQGLSVGVGMALGMKLETGNWKLETGKVYVLMGDSEVSEGSVWEAIQIAAYYKLNNLVGIVDVNRLGQSMPTMLGWDVETYAKRIESFGWDVHVVDGHNFGEINTTFGKLGKSSKPQMIIAKTIKGKGVSFLENKEGWHGKVLNEEQFEEAVRELGEVDRMMRGKIAPPNGGALKTQNSKLKTVNTKYKILNTEYKLGEEVATRKAYGEALAKLGDINSDIVALDGETSNSTYSEIFREKHPSRYFEMFIAEQNMAGVALGLSKRGKIPFASTFSAFMTRAFDQVRMSAYSLGNVKFVGSHAGVSIGEDGPSQMGLEDIAMFRAVFGSVVLNPSDAVSCAKLTAEAAAHEGIVYIRTARPATPVIYENTEEFKIGGSKMVRTNKADKLTIIACGVCVHEAIGACDLLKGDGVNVRVLDAYSIKPLDEKVIKEAASETNNLVLTVEDHYFEGGLGDAVLNVFSQSGLTKVYKLAVSKMPMSGKSSELLGFEGISSVAIYNKVKELLNFTSSRQISEM